MKQLTVRGFDPELASRIAQLARSERISLNQAVLQILRRGAGLADHREDPNVIGAALDRFIGTWSADEADALERAVEVFEKVDADLWR